MRFRWACFTLCAGQFLGCENPRPVLTRVEPAQAYSDPDVRLTLFGDGFVPSTTLDPVSGGRVAVVDGFHALIGRDSSWAELGNLVWQSIGRMDGSLSHLDASAPDFPTGYLDVEIIDPRGQRATLQRAFYELGRDVTPPTVTFTSPPAQTPIGQGTLVSGSFHASAAPYSVLTNLSWAYFEDSVEIFTRICSVPSKAIEVDCAFQVRVGQSVPEGKTVDIVATGIDAYADNYPGSATLSFKVLAKATVTSISPSSGGTAGGTDVVITGSGFIAGSQAILDGVPMFPEGGIVIDENTISAHVPAHDAGATSILVQTPLGTAMGTLFFTYLLPPHVETIEPNTGTAAGGTAVVLTGQDFTSDTQIYFGSTLDSALPLSQLSRPSDNTIIGRTPMGSGQTTVWAFDEALGFTQIPNGFTWRTP